MSRNVGKLFEDDWKDSCPNDCWIYRLRDNAASFAGGNNTRFTSSNICDFIMYEDTSSTLLLLELKSTQKKSLTFWDEKFENKSKKNKTYEIKKSQIIGLTEVSSHKLFAGFIFNFREYGNKTYYLSIDNFNRFVKDTDKKSIGLDDVINYGGILIDSNLKGKSKIRFEYNIRKLIKDIKGE